MAIPRAILAALAGVGLSALLALAGQANPTFTNVTVQAGLDYLQYQVTNPPTAGEPLYMSGGAAAGDYDGDGWTDLYVTRLDAADILFRNQGNGTFQDVTAGSGLDVNLPSNGAGWADLDEDGDQDLYVTTLNGTRHYLFINDGAGSFTEEAVARGAEITTPAPALNGYGPAFGDYDRDGYLDIYVGEWVLGTDRASAARLLHNRGAAQPGYFDDVTAAAEVEIDAVAGAQGGYFAFAPRLTDLDGDGWPDLVIASDFSESRIFWNDGDGTFTDGTVAAGVGGDENGMGSAVGDYDGDGLLDWFVTSIYDPDEPCGIANCGWGYTGNRLYRNMGGRTFSDETDSAGVRDGYWGWGAAFFDYDNDGDLDLGMTNGVDFAFVAPPDNEIFGRYNPDPLRLWRNEGGGPMTEVSQAVGLTDAGSGKGYLTFDYDQDGDLDLFIVNNAAHPVLYRNDGGNAKDWLQVETRGRASNGDSIGARVEVTGIEGEAPQIREIDGGSNFLGHSERVAHFGLGDFPSPYVREVRVVWPKSGRSRVYEWVAKNQRIVMIEPSPFSGSCGLGPEVALLLAGIFWARSQGKRRRAR